MLTKSFSQDHTESQQATLNVSPYYDQLLKMKTIGIYILDHGCDYSWTAFIASATWSDQKLNYQISVVSR